MRIILKQNIKGVGKKHEVKNVADGYATNFLFPRGLAEVATDAKIKNAETARLQEERERKIKEDLLAKSLDSLEGKIVEIEGKANDKGHLFAGIHKEELTQQIKEKTGLEIDEEFIELGQPIKEVGEHLVKIKAGKKEVGIKVNMIKIDK